MCFPLLSFLQLGSSSQVALGWLVALITGKLMKNSALKIKQSTNARVAGGIIDYIVMTVTYICFYNACKVQGLDRKTLPYTGWFQPYCGYIGLVWEVIICACFGYSSFKPWSVSNFFSNYTMVIVSPLLFIAWKLIHRTKFVKSSEADLIWEKPIVDAYEESFLDPPVGFWTEIINLVGLKRTKGGNDKRAGSIS